MALRGIIENAVFAVAGLERRVGHDGELFRRDPAVGRRGEGLIGPHSIGEQSRPEIRRRAGDDALIILRETLSFHQGFPAAVRTAGEIGVGGRLRVVGFDDRLGRRRRLMDRPPAEVDDLLRMAEGPARVQIPAPMARVCRRHRVAPFQRPIHRAVEDVSGETAVADALVFPVPCRLGRQPHFEGDIRVGGWFDRALDAAERSIQRDRGPDIRAYDARRRRDVRRCGNRRGTECLAGEASAIRRLSAARAKRERARRD